MANYMKMSVAPKSTIVPKEDSAKGSQREAKSDKANNYWIMSTVAKKPAADNYDQINVKSSAEKTKPRSEKKEKTRGRRQVGGDKHRRRSGGGGGGRRPPARRRASSASRRDLSAASAIDSGSAVSRRSAKENRCCTTKLTIGLLLVGVIIAGIAGFLVYYFVIGPALQQTTSTDKPINATTPAFTSQTVASPASTNIIPTEVSTDAAKTSTSASILLSDASTSSETSSETTV